LIAALQACPCDAWCDTCVRLLLLLLLLLFPAAESHLKARQVFALLALMNAVALDFTTAFHLAFAQQLMAINLRMLCSPVRAAVHSSCAGWCDE